MSHAKKQRPNPQPSGNENATSRRLTESEIEARRKLAKDIAKEYPEIRKQVI